MTRAPLADLRILSLEQFVAGPFGTLQLADLGAEVIKIEDPASRGDAARYVPPFREGEDSLYFETFNHDKKSLCVDLRRPEGRAVFEDLVRSADAVFSNLRGDEPARLGLTYESLRHVNPRIVCCSLSGFGMTGPRRAEGAYDYVIQGLAGWMSLTGGPDDPPMKSGLSLVDLTGGYVAAIAILAGVWQARRDGHGCDCDLALLDTAISLLGYVGTWVASRGYAPPRLANSAHPSIVPFQTFAASDGWLVVACAKQKFWERLVAVLGRPDLAGDSRYATLAARNEHRALLEAELAKEFGTRSAREWVQLLTGAGVPAGVINDVAAAVADPQIVARGGLNEVDHPRLGRVVHMPSPLRVGAHRRPAGAGPARGSHTKPLLMDLCGYDSATVEQLIADGVVVAA